MTVKRRTYVVGEGYSLTPEEIRAEPDMMVVHLGDPPFTLTLAPPGDTREVVIGLPDESFLTDLQWLTPKRAKGRVLFSLIEGAAEAVEYHLDLNEQMADEMLGKLAAAAEGEGEEGGGTIDPVEIFINQINEGLITSLYLLDFKNAEDLGRALSLPITEEFFQEHKAVIEEMVEEARIRGIPVYRVEGDPDEYHAWLEQEELESGPGTTQAFAKYLYEKKHGGSGQG